MTITYLFPARQNPKHVRQRSSYYYYY